MQENAAHQLCVKSTKTQRTAGPFTTVGKGFGQQRIKAFTAFCAFRQFSCVFFQLSIGQFFKLGFQPVDLVNQGPCGFDFAVVWCPKNLLGECSKTQHDLSTFALRLGA